MDRVRAPFTPPHTGLLRAICKKPPSFIVQEGERHKEVAVERLKAAPIEQHCAETLLTSAHGTEGKPALVAKAPTKKVCMGESRA